MASLWRLIDLKNKIIVFLSHHHILKQGFNMGRGTAWPSHADSAQVQLLILSRVKCSLFKEPFASAQNAAEASSLSEVESPRGRGRMRGAKEVPRVFSKLLMLHGQPPATRLAFPEDVLESWPWSLPEATCWPPLALSHTVKPVSPSVYLHLTCQPSW